MTALSFSEITKKNNNKLIRSVLISSINNKMDSFQEYTQEIESFFNAKTREVVKYGSDIDQITDSEERYWMEEMISDELSKLDDMLGENFRYSVLVSLYSFFEHEIKIICHQLEKINGYTTPLKSEAYVQGVIDYLKNNANTDITSLKNWSFIDDLRLIRNTIAHCHGLVRPNSKRQSDITVISIISARPDLSVNSAHRLKVEDAYIVEAMKNVRELLLELVDKVLPLDNSTNTSIN